MHRITKFLAAARLSSRSLLLKPRDFASETHRSKLSFIDWFASARDALAASVLLFFCADTTVDVPTLTASAATPKARIGRMAFLLLEALSDPTLDWDSKSSMTPSDTW